MEGNLLITVIKSAGECGRTAFAVEALLVPDS